MNWSFTIFFSIRLSDWFRWENQSVGSYCAIIITSRLVFFSTSLFTLCWKCMLLIIYYWIDVDVSRSKCCVQWTWMPHSPSGFFFFCFISFDLLHLHRHRCLLGNVSKCSIHDCCLFFLVWWSTTTFIWFKLAASVCLCDCNNGKSHRLHVHHSIYVLQILASFVGRFAYFFLFVCLLIFFPRSSTRCACVRETEMVDRQCDFRAWIMRCMRQTHDTKHIKL